MRSYSKQATLTSNLEQLQRQFAELPPRPASTPVMTRRRKPRLSPDDIIALVHEYESGASSNHLCAQTGLAKGTILKLLRRGGAKMRNQGICLDDVDHIVRRYAGGVSLAGVQGIGYILARFIDISNLYVTGASLVGLAVAVDYSIFILKRFREGLDAGQDAHTAAMSADGTSIRAGLSHALKVST